MAVKPILFATAAFAMMSIWIASRMDAAYMDVLRHGLLSRAVAVNEADVQDSTTLTALFSTTFNTTQLGRPKAAPPAAAVEHTPVGPAADPVLVRLSELRSGVPARVAAALRPDLPFDPLLVPQAIRLLAWNEAYEWARAFLLLHAHRSVGQLVDALLDQSQDFAVRRRIPRILAYSSSQRAVDGLMVALADSRFEIRYHAGRALEFLHRMADDLRFDSEIALAAVEREISIPQPIWEERRLLDSGDQSDDQYWFLDDILKSRAGKSLEHVFSLLALMLPGEPLRVAFRALHSDDRMLRALALEYLESHIPEVIVSQLARLAGAAPSPAARPPQLVLDELMASQQTILGSLQIPSSDVRG
jgi:hypothetical protein